MDWRSDRLRGGVLVFAGVWVDFLVMVSILSLCPGGPAGVVPASAPSGAVSWGRAQARAEGPEDGSGAGAQRPGAVRTAGASPQAERGLQRATTGPNRTHPRGGRQTRHTGSPREAGKNRSSMANPP